MSISSLLLRALLGMILVANGIGFAQASTRMQLANAAYPSMPDVAEECHSNMQGGAASPHAAMGPEVMAHDQMPAAGDPAPVDGMDCCDGNNCQCACNQNASAAFMGAFGAGPVPMHSLAQLGGASRHASPRLSDFIRPPIG